MLQVCVGPPWSEKWPWAGTGTKIFMRDAKCIIVNLKGEVRAETENLKLGDRMRPALQNQVHES